MRLGTTRGTNALLTRRGARSALVATRGFKDMLRIGHQNRPRLFELAIHKPPPLFERVIEIDERVTHDGQVLKAPCEATIRTQLAELYATGVRSLAICLMNAYNFAAHETLVERLAREVGFAEVSRSSRVAPLVKLVARGDTTLVDAYLNPVLRAYVETLRRQLAESGAAEATGNEQAERPGASTLRILTSAGGLVDADHFTGKDSVLSGPAGGVVGVAAAAQAAGFARALGFDMGGTSTDVSRYDGGFDRQYETEKAGVRIVAPMMAIETVAAGGGSICRFDGVKLCVGPDSAGADPGPACYGRGGPLTLTDANVALGRVLPQRFPFPLDRAAALRRLDELSHTVAAATGRRQQPLELADGLVRIANAHMAQAIRSVSIAKGCDPRDYALVAFGGAAGQHACAVARELGVGKILNHPDAGVLSALGIGMANIERHRVEGVYRLWSELTADALDEILARLADEARQEAAAEGVPPARIATAHALDLRYAGLDAHLTISRPAGGDWIAAYEAEHLAIYGYTHCDKPVEVVAARATAVGGSDAAPPMARRVSPVNTLPGAMTHTMWADGAPHAAAVHDREAFKPGDAIVGPALVLEQVATTVVDPGWQAEVLSDGQMLFTATSGAAPAASDANAAAEADPVLLEIFNNQLAAIAEQMGITLRNTASSVNVKERLDFSCAVFTPEGELVVNAPHIPVHLGAMGITVRAVLADNPNLQSGDVIVTNDPYRGGSHLPDITVVTPVFSVQGELVFFTASR
ncbi:MAG: hydantoinase B/oxoprolinase family protein, partial [Planctomycetales bacterium]|nr:hydantoinase B/oxoprolinase family protein [Planctomycetales bacterium]